MCSKELKYSLVGAFALGACVFSLSRMALAVASLPRFCYRTTRASPQCHPSEPLLSAPLEIIPPQMPPPLVGREVRTHRLPDKGQPPHAVIIPRPTPPSGTPYFLSVCKL